MKIDPIRDATIEAGVRWCSNILIEIADHNRNHMSREEREAISRAIKALADYQLARMNRRVL
jgi:hypothetical protein